MLKILIKKYGEPIDKEEKRYTVMVDEYSVGRALQSITKIPQIEEKRFYFKYYWKLNDANISLHFSDSELDMEYESNKYHSLIKEEQAKRKEEERKEEERVLEEL